MEINWVVIAVFDPLLCLHHIPSPLCLYILHTLTIKMSQRQSIHFRHQKFSPKPNETIMIHFIRPDKIREADERQRERRVRTKLTKAGKGDGESRRRIVYRSFLLQQPSVCVFVCAFSFMCLGWRWLVRWVMSDPSSLAWFCRHTNINLPTSAPL